MAANIKFSGLYTSLTTGNVDENRDLIFFEMFLFILKRFQTLTVCSPALSSGALEKIICRSLVFNYIILLCLRY